MRKTLSFVALSVILTIMSFLTVLASPEPGTVLSHGIDSGDIIAYLANPAGSSDFDVSCQIGQSQPDTVSCSLVSDSGTIVKTLILLDNSLSVKEKYRSFISATISDIIDSKLENEQITLAVFSDHITYILEDSNDKEALKKVLAEIQYSDQETYLTDVLCDYYRTLPDDDGSVFRRIVVVSDGVDNKAIGYTRAELEKIIAEKPFPIYSLGCSNGSNNEQLKNMFSLSRMTGGKEFLLDDLKDTSEILEGLNETNGTIRAVITPQKKDLDGSKKAVQVVTTINGSNYSDTIECRMPFGAIEDTETASIDETQTQIVAKQSEPAATEPKVIDALKPAIGNMQGTEKQGNQSSDGIKIAAAVILLLIALLIVARMVLKPKKGTKSSKKKTPPVKKTNKTQAGENSYELRPTTMLETTPAEPDYDSVKTTMLEPEMPAALNQSVSELPDMDHMKTTILYDEDDTRTEVLEEDPDDVKTEKVESEPEPERSIILVLTDAANSVRRTETEITGTSYIGRGSDCKIKVEGRSISRKHARITRDGDTLYIENVSETNQTVLNGNPTTGKVLLTTGSTLALGSVVFNVEIR